jgi:membrane-associated phospholipid phosphatase
MGNIYDSGIQIILFFQGLGDWIIPIMKGFTFLGEKEFFLLIAPFLYWCIDTTIGFRTAMMLIVSTSTYHYGKWLIHSPRPPWYSTVVNAHVMETSFGTPSGHSTSAVTIWGILADSFRTKSLWIIAVTLMFLIGLSRIVLAAHFPHDVLLGWLTGALILALFIRLEPVVKTWLTNKSNRFHYGLYLVISIALILISLLVLMPLKDWNLPSIWIDNAKRAFPGEELINPMSLADQITIAGAFLGLAVGHKLLFSRNGYSTKGVWWKLTLRYLVGVLGVFSIWFGLDLLFPDGDTVFAYLFRYLRYSLVGFWVTFLAPTLFITLKLAKPSRSQ